MHNLDLQGIGQSETLKTVRNPAFTILDFAAFVSGSGKTGPGNWDL